MKTEETKQAVTAHSPEPWTYDESRSIVSDGNDVAVAYVCGGSWDEMHANGHRIAALSAENARLREALERIERAYYPEPVTVSTLPAGYGVSPDEVDTPGPWHGVRLEDGEERGWARTPFPMSRADVGLPNPSASSLADIARTALRAGGATP